MHLFHVIAPPHAEVMGGGASGADELLVEPPDLAADQEMVRTYVGPKVRLISKYKEQIGGPVGLLYDCSQCTYSQCTKSKIEGPLPALNAIRSWPLIILVTPLARVTPKS